ncbi:MAG TPA: hypothetical protein VG734_23015 [Lacunisphaera sp.]|nr:hypothetical protein [Lacunisphaera sp.]
MHRSEGQLVLSATDLSSFFECEYRTILDLEVLGGRLERPPQNDLERRILQERGREHEARVLNEFVRQGLGVVNVPEEVAAGTGSDAGSVTLAAMTRGADLIYQGTLQYDGWEGRPDFLQRAACPDGVASRFGDYLYEPVDAKLAREEKARAVLQLCAYADLLLGLQGLLPQRMWLALGTQELVLQPLKTTDHAAFQPSEAEYSCVCGKRPATDFLP